MGKRSNFERAERDFYPTPLAAVEPLINHLPKTFLFAEPCAGNGQLVSHLQSFGGKCFWESDVDPILPITQKMNALKLTTPLAWCNKNDGYIITNPPWDRKILHPMIEHFSNFAPTWLLFDSDWAHTRQSAELIKRCQKIVSVGRVKWIPDSKMTGKDNCCWYLFWHENKEQPKFYGRG